METLLRVKACAATRRNAPCAVPSASARVSQSQHLYKDINTQSFQRRRSTPRKPPCNLALDLQYPKSSLRLLRPLYPRYHHLATWERRGRHGLRLSVTAVAVAAIKVGLLERLVRSTSRRPLDFAATVYGVHSTRPEQGVPHSP